MNDSQDKPRSLKMGPPAPQDDQSRAIRAAIADATLPYKFGAIVRGVLKDTPEYAEARAEGHAKAWLEQESNHICAALAAALRDQLTRLDPLHG